MRVPHTSTANAASSALNIAHRHVHAHAGDIGGKLVVLHDQFGVSLAGRHFEAALLDVLHLVVVDVRLL